MNDYITLNGKRYKTPSTNWAPVYNKPSTVRYTLLGAADATYGPAMGYEWQGEIEVPYSATAPWGSLSDFQATLALMTSCSFIDHLGTSYTVHVVGPQFRQRSLMSMWDSNSNKFYIPVRLIKV